MRGECLPYKGKGEDEKGYVKSASRGCGSGQRGAAVWGSPYKVAFCHGSFRKIL